MYGGLRPRSWYELPKGTQNILAINIILFILKYVSQNRGFGNVLDDNLSMYYFETSKFRPWQIITANFMHADFKHLIYNMLGLYFIGTFLEDFWGTKKYLMFYLITGVASMIAMQGVYYGQFHESIAQAKEMMISTDLKTLRSYLEQNVDMIYAHGLDINGLVNNLYNPSITNNELTVRIHEAIGSYTELIGTNTQVLGASGAVFGFLAAFAFLFPNTELYLYFMIPIKAKYLVLGYAAIEFFTRNSNDGVAHWGHLGGAAAGIITVYIWRKTSRTMY